MQHVLDKHHGAIHQDAEVDGAHGNQVCGHAQKGQTNERHEQRQRDNHGDDHRTGDATQEEPDD